MKIEQIYTACLAHGAYYIESEGEVAIVDPLREYQPYLDRAVKDKARIKYILETHFHADFVSGHLDLAQKTGAAIVYGPNANTGFEAYIARDQEILPVGKIHLVVLHTPGHTPESTTYLLRDENGRDRAIFTGDTLFIGDVGRPDLAVESNLSRENLAGMLYDSLRNTIMPLGDDVIVYPAHGQGSACGKNMSKETFDTLGRQKATNYALRANMTKEEFIKEITEGLAQPPQYFPKNVLLNKQGYNSLDTILAKGLLALSAKTFQDRAKEKKALILDTRAPQVFKKGFIKGAVNIGIKGEFAPWVGALIKELNQATLIVADKGKEKEVVTRLARVGYDNSIGYLEGGMEAWKTIGGATETIESISATEFEQRLKTERYPILDVRKTKEYQAEHIEGAQHFPLSQLERNLNRLDKNQTYYVHCAGGYRSMIASSMLKAAGFENLIEIAGGFNAIKKTDIARTKFACPSTL